jgi:uncharacterized protein (TIGR00645 family)
MPKPDSSTEKFLEKTIFASRWLQAPLYVGLIIAQGVYVYQFFFEALAWTDKLMMANVKTQDTGAH